MKINIDVDGNHEETEITIKCNAMSDELEKVIATLRALDCKLTGKIGGLTYIIDASKVFYIDTVDKKTFLYTESDVFETALRLFELEELLPAHDFFRAGKSSIINFNKIKSMKSDIDGRIIVAMENDEKLVVSRQYTYFIKMKLGGRSHE